MMLRDSADQKVSRARVEVSTGRRWRADKAVNDAESRLRHSDVVGTTTSGRLGLGCDQSQLEGSITYEEEEDGTELSSVYREGD